MNFYRRPQNNNIMGIPFLRVFATATRATTLKADTKIRHDARDNNFNAVATLQRGR